MISVEEMRKLEEKAFASGVDVDELMERAGKACAEEIEERLGTGKKIAVFIGPGNNGGDGLVAARYLKKSNNVSLVLVKEPSTGAAKKNLERAKKAGLGFSGVRDADVIIDAMLGIGAKGELRGEIREACRRFNLMAGFKIAIDVPTGVDADSGESDGDAARVDATICLHECKQGCAKAGKNISGELWIVDIGL
jgi:hydroxyethylthiazole kinase-like uncharacterized protein yjeF